MNRERPEAPFSPRRRRLCGCALGVSLLAACGRDDKGGAAAPAVPVEIDASAACALDGMQLADYPGPKGQIHYADAKAPEWYCDTLEVLAMLRRPERVRPLRAAYVQDMARADWEQPRGHWIDARSAVYVIGSRKRGGMGKTAASFANAEDAQAFVAQHGGRALRFDEIGADMTDLSGGALHDSRM